jgi:Protein of unknown function (DUF3631)
VFKRENGSNLASAGIAHSLNQMESRPWPDFNRGAPITPTNIAKLLKPFKIFPRQVRVGSVRALGYKSDQFKYVFKRYLGEA